MQDVNLVFYNFCDQPGKEFLVCDLNFGGTFADPLELFSLDEYDIHNVNKRGFYAVGGNLDIKTLLASYKWGIFPWFPYKLCDDIEWYCPRQRYVIFPEEIHVGHSLRNLINKNRYHITLNQAFRDVIHNCRNVDQRDSSCFSWLGETIEDLFIELHEMGYAKSVEVWDNDKLVGGFYGFWYNGVFQGESMFSLSPSASQIGLVLLCRNPFINGKKIKLIDTQFETPTFKHLGAEYIPYSHFRQLIDY